VVAQTEWAANSLIERYGVDPERLRVIPFGVTVDDPVTRVEPEVPEVTFVGSTLDRKGGGRLLRVFRSGLGSRCVLNLVTRDKVSPESGVRVFRDYSPDDPRLKNLLARTTVFAFPSDMDTFGYGVIEAMAMGVPVVATPTGGITEVVVDGETGVIVDHDDRALRTAIEDLLADEAQRKRMGAAGRARVEERFDASKTTSQLITVLEEAYRARNAR
jgi:alpha-maltose-1-phosphate synthase